MSGIYFINHMLYNPRNIYKLGFSGNLNSRLSNYNTMAIPDEHYQFLKIIVTENYMNSVGELRYFEGICHNLWKKYRMGNSEMFEVDDFKTDFSQIISELENMNMKVHVYDHIPPYQVRYSDREYELFNSEVKCDYSYQTEKVKLTNEFFKTNSEGMLVYPPGWGKTFIAGKIMNNYRNIVIFVPQILIANEFCKMIYTLKLKYDVEIINSDYTSGKNMKKIEDGQIKIITYQSYENCSGKLVNVDLVVYDEAHHTNANKFKQTTLLKSNKKLYLTATPKIVDEFNIKIPVIDSETIRDSIDKGRLCDYRLIIHNNCDTLDMVKELIQKHHRKKILVFFNKREKGVKSRKSEIFSKRLNENNIKSYDLHGELKRKQKDDILKDFSSDAEVQVICNVNMVSEGVSIPCADCIIFAEPRKSSIGVIQNIGRVLRKSPSKDISLICLPPNMADAASIINILYHQDKRLQKVGINMFVGKKKEILDIQQILKLIEISKTGGLWEYKYKLCELYEKEYNVLIVLKTLYLGQNIGKWICRNTSFIRCKQISDARKSLLMKLNTVKDKLSNKWLEKYDLFAKCDNENNKSQTMKDWMQSQKTNLKNGFFDKEEHKYRLPLLEKLESWGNTNAKIWMKKYTACFKYETDYPTKFITRYITDDKGMDLGMFIKDNRDNERNGRFENNAERLILLKKLRSWNKTSESVWNDKFNLCLAYETENRLNIISNSQKFKYNNKNFKPKEWLSDNTKRTTIPEERLILLKTLRTWSYIDNKWNYMIKLCTNHENNKITELEEKKCVVWTNKGRKHWKIKELTKHGNIPIGKWFATNAKKYKNNTLQQTERSTLENIKSLKYFIRDDWKYNYDLCVEYEELNPDIIASRHSKGPIGTKLMYKFENIGGWIGSQRSRNKKKKLSEKKFNLLKLIKSF